MLKVFFLYFKSLIHYQAFKRLYKFYIQLLFFVHKYFLRKHCNTLELLWITEDTLKCLINSCLLNIFENLRPTWNLNHFWKVKANFVIFISFRFVFMTFFPKTYVFNKCLCSIFQYFELFRLNLNKFYFYNLLIAIFYLNFFYQLRLAWCN